MKNNDVLKMYKLACNSRYEVYYKTARTCNRNESNINMSFRLEAAIDGIVQVAIQDNRITYEDFDKLLEYGRTLRNRFDKRFDV